MKTTVPLAVAETAIACKSVSAVIADAKLTLPPEVGCDASHCVVRLHDIVHRLSRHSVASWQ